MSFSSAPGWTGRSLKEETQLHAHLAQCPHCRQLAQELEDLQTQMTSLWVEPPDSLKDALASQDWSKSASSSPPRSPTASPSKRRHLLPWLARAAAAVVLVVGLCQLLLPGGADGLLPKAVIEVFQRPEQDPAAGSEESDPAAPDNPDSPQDPSKDTEQQAEQENRSDQDTQSGRTCPEHIRATKERTSDVSSKKSAKSQKEMFQFLDLRKTSGGKAQSWAMGIQSLGEHLTLNIGECPKEESVSTLSQILEETPHRKYYLSVKACLGILRRAEKRGKELPEILRQALIRQAQLMSSAMTSATGAE